MTMTFIKKPEGKSQHWVWGLTKAGAKGYNKKEKKA